MALKLNPAKLDALWNALVDERGNNGPVLRANGEWFSKNVPSITLRDVEQLQPAFSMGWHLGRKQADTPIVDDKATAFTNAILDLLEFAHELEAAAFVAEVGRLAKEHMGFEN